ncbi:MAG: D-alanyl-D-alanine carboxypeptidase family protein [Paracoccaceae bacterium]
MRSGFFSAVLTALLLALPASAGQVVLDVKSGRVLAGHDVNQPRYPASITKLMTIHVALDAVAAGKLGWNTPLTVSTKAASAPPVKLGLRAGEIIPLNKAIHAALILSSNDAARVIAEAVSGSETAFAKQMTQTARRIGMRATTFRNASGLPDRGHVTTALDMARLMASVDQKHGKRLHRLFRTPLVWKGKSHRPRNGTVASPAGSVLGKTGFTCDAGFTAAILLDKGGARTAIVTLANRGKDVRANAIRALSKGRVSATNSKLGKLPVVLPRASCGKAAKSKARAPVRRIRAEGWMLSLGDFRTRAEAEKAISQAAALGIGLPGLVARREGGKGFHALLGAPDSKSAQSASKALRGGRVRARILPPEKVSKAGFKPA